MTNGAKIVVASVAGLIVAVGGEMLYLHHRNTADENVKVQQRGVYEKGALADDDTVMYSLKHMRPDSLKDIRELVGKDV